MTDDMTTLERRLTEELGQMMGRGRSVDAMELARTTAQVADERRWGVSRRSTALMGSTAVVLLFGAGIAATTLLPTSEAAPLPQVGSASIPGVELTTEEVATGLTLVTAADGVAIDGVIDLVVTPEGHVWVAQDGALAERCEVPDWVGPGGWSPPQGCSDQLVRQLGGAGATNVVDMNVLDGAQFDVREDGAILGRDVDGAGYHRLVDGEWVSDEGACFGDHASIAPDGTCWTRIFPMMGHGLIRTDVDGESVELRELPGLSRPARVAVGPDGEVSFLVDGGIAFFGGNGIRHVYFEPALPDAVVTDLAIGPDGIVWVSVNGKRRARVMGWDGSEWITHRASEQLPTWLGTGTHALPDGSILFGGLSAILTPDGLREIGLEAQVVRVTPDGTVWAVIENQLYHVDPYRAEAPSP